MFANSLGKICKKKLPCDQSLLENCNMITLIDKWPQEHTYLPFSINSWINQIIESTIFIDYSHFHNFLIYFIY